jgi:hypothetical protein
MNLMKTGFYRSRASPVISAFLNNNQKQIYLPSSLPVVQ